jgi:hypothetical protein
MIDSGFVKRGKIDGPEQPVLPFIHRTGVDSLAGIDDLPGAVVDELKVVEAVADLGFYHGVFCLIDLVADLVDKNPGVILSMGDPESQCQYDEEDRSHIV